MANQKKTDVSRAPRGDLVIRCIAMPENTNANGDIFGGWILSMMDLGGSVMAKRVSESRVTTVAIEGMSFLNPVLVGDIVSCYAVVKNIGRTSMKINLETWVERHIHGQLLCVTEGIFTFVAIDDNGRPIPVKREI